MARVKDKGFVENFLKRDGRLNRWRYFKRLVALFLISELVIIVAGTITIIIFYFLMPDASFWNNDAEIRNYAIIFAQGVCLLMTPAYFCLMVRRLHDLNRGEAIAYWLTAVSCANILGLDLGQREDSILENILQLIHLGFTIYLLFFRGTKGNNQYGSDPLER